MSRASWPSTRSARASARSTSRSSGSASTRPSARATGASSAPCWLRSPTRAPSRAGRADPWGPTQRCPARVGAPGGRGADAVTLSVIATVFALIAVAELPDKTMIATLVMGARGRPLLVWLGASGAFFVHVTVAVAAGRFLELLPHRTVQIVVTVIFLLGAAYLLFIPEKSEEARGAREAEGELPRGDAQPGAVLAPADASGARLAAAAGAGAPIATATAWRIVAGAFGGI